MGLFDRKKVEPKQDKPIVRSYAHQMADRINKAERQHPSRSISPAEEVIWNEAWKNGIHLTINENNYSYHAWEPEGAHNDYEPMNSRGPFIDPFTDEWSE